MFLFDHKWAVWQSREELPLNWGVLEQNRTGGERWWWWRFALTVWVLKRKRRGQTHTHKHTDRQEYLLWVGEKPCKVYYSLNVSRVVVVGLRCLESD